MPKDRHEADGPYVARIPADVARSDRVLGPFTARQCAQLAVVGALLYGGYFAARPLMAPLAYLAMVIPVAGVLIAVVLGRREGIGLDRFLLAALTFARTPRRRVHAPEGVPPLPAFVPEHFGNAAGPDPVPLELPAAGVDEAGVLDLADHGQAGLAVCSTVNFALRTAAEQQGLIAAFARWLNSLTGPVQIMLHAHRIDLAPLAARLHRNAPALPHVALERAARAHADFLTELAEGRDITARRHLVVLREAGPAAGSARERAEAATRRARQRLAESARALASAEVEVRPLDAAGARRALALSCEADLPTQHPEA
ncbi:PrgI family protein [Streptomyces boninensis]|uniref:PrgI family protein n=1 Tax=Streptomyces boninensis TaxID=2039455 RepID=UPI003B2183F8